MSARSANEGVPSGPVVRCIGCGFEPQVGQVHRLPDGSDCRVCVVRLVEAQPTLLPRAPIAVGEPVGAETNAEALEPVAGALPSMVGRPAGRERFRLLAGSATESAPAGVPILDPGPPEPA